MSNKTIHNIIEDTKKLLEQNLLPNAPFQNKSILTEETLNEQMESQVNNGREEATIFYLAAPLIKEMTDGIPEINLNIESVWVNKETLEIVEEPEWRKEEVRQRRQKMKEEEKQSTYTEDVENLDFKLSTNGVISSLQASKVLVSNIFMNEKENKNENK